MFDVTFRTVLFDDSKMFQFDLGVVKYQLLTSFSIFVFSFYMFLSCFGIHFGSFWGSFWEHVGTRGSPKYHRTSV